MKYLITIFAVLLSASATFAQDKPTDAPVPTEMVVPSQQPATIYFYRPRRFAGSALKPTVFLDDARVGRLHNGDSIKFSVTPGPHRIYSTDKSTGMELDAKAGQTYYVRIDIQTGLFKGHGGVTLVDPQQGKYEVTQSAHQGRTTIADVHRKKHKTTTAQGYRRLGEGERIFAAMRLRRLE